MRFCAASCIDWLAFGADLKWQLESCNFWHFYIGFISFLLVWVWQRKDCIGKVQWFKNNISQLKRHVVVVSSPSMVRKSGVSENSKIALCEDRAEKSVEWLWSSGSTDFKTDSSGNHCMRSGTSQKIIVNTSFHFICKLYTKERKKKHIYRRTKNPDSFSGSKLI